MGGRALWRRNLQARLRALSPHRPRRLQRQRGKRRQHQHLQGELHTRAALEVREGHGDCRKRALLRRHRAQLVEGARPLERGHGRQHKDSDLELQQDLRAKMVPVAGRRQHLHAAKHVFRQVPDGQIERLALPARKDGRLGAKVARQLGERLLPAEEPAHGQMARRVERGHGRWHRRADLGVEQHQGAALEARTSLRRRVEQVLRRRLGTQQQDDRRRRLRAHLVRHERVADDEIHLRHAEMALHLELRQVELHHRERGVGSGA